MADMVSLGTQTVNVGDNVAFTTNRIGGNCQNIRHEPGSGRVTLLPGLYRVGFNGNFSAVAAGTLAFEIRQDGDSIPGSKIISTVTAAGYGNGSSTVEVRVNRPCCSTLSVRNIGTVAAIVSDANLVVSRIG